MNLDNLSEFLKWRFPDRGQNYRDDIADLLSEIRSLGYTTLAELDTILNQTLKAVIAYESKYPPADSDTGEPGTYFQVGFMRTALKFVNHDYRRESSFLEEIEEFISSILHIKE